MRGELGVRESAVGGGEEYVADPPDNMWRDRNGWS